MRRNNGLELLEGPVRRVIEEVVALGPGAVAAFDADGTLWEGDLGEALLLELHREGRLPPPTPADPFLAYEQLLASDPPRAFALCVELMRGLEEDAVVHWSRQVYRRQFAARVFPGMRAVLEAFRGAGIRVLLVSASGAIPVRVAAIELGLEPDDVLAVGCPVDDSGRLTGRVDLPVTCSEGKVQAIERAVGGRAPAIAFGNSLFDREMLEHAARAVMVAPPDIEGPATRLARERGWPIHRPRPPA